MSCICSQPIRPEFKDSYNDLLDKPQINGVTLAGNLTPADLGIKAGAQFKIVSQLPVTDIDEATVYLVPVQVGQTDNIYQEWIYINNAWEKIGEPISIQAEKPSVRWESLAGYCTPTVENGVVGYDVFLTSKTLAKQTLGLEFDNNTAYLSIATLNIFRGLEIYNNTSYRMTLWYYYNEGYGDASISQDFSIEPGYKIGLNGTLFVGNGEGQLVVDGKFMELMN